MQDMQIYVWFQRDSNIQKVLSLKQEYSKGFISETRSTNLDTMLILPQSSNECTSSFCIRLNFWKFDEIYRNISNMYNVNSIYYETTFQDQYDVTWKLGNYINTMLITTYWTHWHRYGD
jgi:hypothetical protein